MSPEAGAPASFEGRVAIVTGAASGIGREIARALAGAGAKLILADLDADGVAEAAGETGGVGIAVDVGDAEAVAEMVALAGSEHGRLDVLINNAGIGRTAPLEELGLERWDNVLAVNLSSVFYATQLAWPYLKETRGSVVSTASIAGLVSAPGRTAYSAAKAGVLGLTRALAIEGAPHGIRVNAVAPGAVETPMVLNHFTRSADPAQRRREFVDPIPLGRLASPSEVAAATVFLASDAASFITGTTLVVDGGQTAH